MYTLKNDFIVLNRTECYFIDWTNMVIGIGTIIAYDNIHRRVTIKHQIHPNEYVILYRARDYIWFRLEEALKWFNDYLRDYGMIRLAVMDLSNQLDGHTTTFNLSEPIYSNYTIYLNGLRQDRNDFVVDNVNLILTMNADYIPTSDDTLSIEYLKVNRLEE